MELVVIDFVTNETRSKNSTLTPSGGGVGSGVRWLATCPRGGAAKQPKKKKAKIASTGNAIITVIKKENLDDSDANSEMKFNRSMDPKNTSGFVSKSDKERTIEKMRRLQSGRSNGTYVQCCVVLCAKWRYIEGCEDPSQIPDNWECKMNTNILR